MKAYIGGPLFNDSEKAFNLKVDALVQSLGITTYLPQRDGGEATQLVKQGEDPALVSSRLFNLDVQEVHVCDLFLFLLDGRVPDEGACVELGIAYALGKICIGYQTDARRFAMSFNNLMIDRALNGGIATSEEELVDLLRKAIARRGSQQHEK